jgi:hypothetical protein
MKFADYDEARFQKEGFRVATGQVNVFADLRARADGGPGINHGAFINISADVDITRLSMVRKAATSIKFQ